MITKKIIYFLVAFLIIFVLFNSYRNYSGKRNPELQDSGHMNYISKDEPDGKFTLYDKEGNIINYKKGFEDGINSTMENTFFDLDQKIKIIQDNFSPMAYGEVLITSRYNFKSAIAIFDFKQDGKIVMDEYIESPIFDQLILKSYFVDIDNDGDNDIFAVGDSGGINNGSTPWILQNSNGKYRLITPLSPSNVDRFKVLTGEVGAENSIIITVYPAPRAIWLHDLDGDNVLELATLDRLNLSGEEDKLNFTMRVYKLINGIYTIQSEKEIDRKGADYKEINSWAIIPDKK